MSGIVVGIDGSGHSEQALDWAAREAGLRQVPLTVITVHQPVMTYWGTAMTYPEDRAITVRIRDEARELADKVIARLGEKTPPQVNITAVSGTPAEELLVAANDADMIVVGSRGAGGFARLLLGSVSSQVVHHAHCPVVVIPASNR